MSEGKKSGRRTYDESFKRDAVRLIVEAKYTYARAAEAVGVSEQSLRERRRKYGPPTAPSGEGASTAELKAENARLRRELKQARLERDILKKPPHTSRRSRREVCPDA